MTMTIKELADELGVSKQTVQYHFKSLPANSYTKSDKGVYRLKANGIEILKEKIAPKPTEDSDKEPTKETDELYSFFSLQLKEKDKQIGELMSGQKNLQKLLDQQQQLTLQANIKIKELETTLTETEVTEEEQTEPMKESDKKSFWQRLFH